MAILAHLDEPIIRTIHLPFYICDSVVNACVQSGYKIHFYELDANFSFPASYLEQVANNEVILSVNYFGLINDNEVISTIKSNRPDVIVISDQVQSFWTYTESVADYSFTSLRKHFPVPDGAFIYARHRSLAIDESIPSASFYRNKVIGSLLKFQRLPDHVFINFLKEGERELNNETSFSTGSNVSAFLFNALDTEAFKQQRKENNKLAYELGNKNGIEFVFPYNENAIPMNIPIKVNKRDAVRKKLMDENVFLPVHWALCSFNNQSIMASQMSKNELSLVIDHRYDAGYIEYEIKLLVKAIKYA